MIGFSVKFVCLASRRSFPVLMCVSVCSVLEQGWRLSFDVMSKVMLDALRLKVRFSVTTVEGKKKKSPTATAFCQFILAQDSTGWERSGRKQKPKLK